MTEWTDPEVCKKYYQRKKQNWRAIRFYVDLEDCEEIKRIALQRNCTVSDVMREMVTWYLETGV
jgi:hypothetical protein